MESPPRLLLAVKQAVVDGDGFPRKVAVLPPQADDLPHAAACPKHHGKQRLPLPIPRVIVGGIHQHGKLELPLHLGGGAQLAPQRGGEQRPDHRLSLLLQAFSSLLQRYPPERITERLLAREAGISCAPLSTRPAARFFRRLAAAVPARPTLQSLLAANLQRLRDNPYPAPTAESLKTAFRGGTGGSFTACGR